jgi:serine/threonine protein kinase
MKFLCPTCQTPLPVAAAVVACTGCGVSVDLTRVETSPGSSALSPEVDLTGETLGAFHLGARLGAGGMGAVYEADGPPGPCAVKVLATSLGAEPTLRQRFRREAAALRTLDHPGVVRVLAEGEDRGFCWYAMERIQGPDLRARLAQGPLSVAEAERLGREVLSALDAVHGRGLVHRDVKPGNILLSPQGAKLCDFGIARFDGSTTLTESAALMGSLRYMSPEQRRGLADAQSDLYALGLVLHEALTGGLPDEVELGRVPAHLKRLIAALLQDKPKERPAHARAALELMRARPFGGRRVWAGAAGLAAVSAVAVLGVTRLPPTPSPVAKLSGPPDTQAAFPVQRNLGSSPADLPTNPVDTSAPQAASPVWQAPPNGAYTQNTIDYAGKEASARGGLDRLQSSKLLGTMNTRTKPSPKKAPARQQVDEAQLKQNLAAQQKVIAAQPPPSRSGISKTSPVDLQRDDPPQEVGSKSASQQQQAPTQVIRE